MPLERAVQQRVNDPNESSTKVNPLVLSLDGAQRTPVVSPVKTRIRARRPAGRGTGSDPFNSRNCSFPRIEAAIVGQSPVDGSEGYQRRLSRQTKSPESQAMRMARIGDTQHDRVWSREWRKMGGPSIRPSTLRWRTDCRKRTAYNAHPVCWNKPAQYQLRFQAERPRGIPLSSQ